ncbi:MAG: HpaII family restriction endonuclease [Methanomassiliicoccaceae archaeon]|nr:HpaII family restriction endonuclease [Methanomassiliicoccaceae archaeon]
MKTDEITGNKGEWSELYAFLKLLGERRIYGADGDLNVRRDVYYDINKIIREEKKGETVEYVVNENMMTIDAMVNGELKARFDFERFEEEAEYLFDRICSFDGTFTVDRTVEFMERIGCTKLKAPSKEKTDITVGIHDYRTGMEPILGFSIKSNIGGNSTLLNSSGATNFIFELEGATDADMKAINSQKETRNSRKGPKENTDLKSRTEYIREKGLNLKYAGTQSEAFRCNMIAVDSNFPEIAAEILKEFFMNGEAQLEKLAKSISASNPFGCDLSRSQMLYELKIKKFLIAIATGMVPHSYWNGRKDATGGYFIVKETGDIVCFHLYNSDDFEDYLLKNTYLDKPSASKHGYGNVEKTSDGKYIMKLNLQIRFKKAKPNAKTRQTSIL